MYRIKAELFRSVSESDADSPNRKLWLMIMGSPRYDECNPSRRDGKQVVEASATER